MNLKTLVEESDTSAGRAFDLTVQALIFASLITFSIETLPNLSNETRYWLYVAEVVTVSLFTIEYGLRILVADNRLAFVFSFYGLIDVLAILPFYVSTGIDLRAVRALRLFRLFRVLKLFRYTAALQRMKAAFVEIKDELLLYVFATGMLMFLASVGIYYFEGDTQPDKFGSVFHCLWWAIVTLTTVGYGDVYPVTVGGRIFTALVLLLGLGTIAVPTGLLASALSGTRKNAEPIVDPGTRTSHDGEADCGNGKETEVTKDR